MGVITQKDIIKVINSSVDNIQVIVDTLAKNISKVTKSANAATLKTNLKLFNEIQKFINEYINVSELIINTIPKLKFSKLQSKLALKSIKNVVNTILGFVNSLSDDAFKKFDPKTLLIRLTDIRKIVVEVETLFKSTSSMIKNSIVIVLFGWLIKIAIYVIISIVKAIIKLTTLSVSKDRLKSFKDFKLIIDDIYDISKKLIKLIPLSIIATVGAMVVTLFVLELCVLILAVGLLSKTMKFISKQAVKGIRRLSKVFKALIWVSIWILILAITAPAVTTALLTVIALVLILMLSVTILTLALFLTSKLSIFARKYAIRIAWNIILITGIFIIMCLAIVLAGIAGTILLEDGAILKIVVGLTGIAVMLSLFIVIGKIMDKAKKYLASLKTSLVPLLSILGLIALIIVEMVALILFGEFLMQGNHIIHIIVGLFAILVVASIIVLITIVLDKANKQITKASGLFSPLITTMILIGLAALSIIAFGEIGRYLKDNIENVLFGLISILIVAGILVAIGYVLSLAKTFLTEIQVAVVPLIIIFGLFVAVGLSIIAFGEIGKYLEENLVYVLAGLGAIVAVALVMIGLGAILTTALPFMSLTLVGALTYSAVMGILIIVALAINKFGEIDVSAFQNVVLGNIESIILVGFALLKLGIAMGPIAVGCTLLIALFIPLLSAILLVALAVKSIEIISKVKIDNKAVNINIQSISLFWESVKNLLDTFKLKDLALFSFALIVCTTIATITLTIENIAKRLQKIASIELDDVAILGNVEKIFNCVTDLAAKVEDLLNGPAANSPLFEVPETGFFSFFKKTKPTAKDKLDNVKKILTTLTGIVYGLNEIQKFTLQKDAITNNVDTIFTFISNLSTLISKKLSENTVFDDKIIEESTWWGGTKTHTEKNDSFKRLDKVSQIISILGSISTALNSIQKLKIDDGKINNNVDHIFSSIQKICTHIKDNMNGLNVFDDNVTWTWVEGGLFSSGYWEKHIEENQTTKKISEIEKVVSFIGKIMESLKLLSEVKLTEDVKSTINANIKNVFDYIQEITIMVDDLMNPKNSGLIGNEAAHKNNIANVINEKSSEYAENLGSVGQIFKTLNDVLDSLNKIRDIKFTQKDSKRIQDNITTLFNAVEYVIGVTNERLETLEGQSIDTENLDLVVAGITTITDTVEEINNLKLIDFNKNTKSMIDFLTKISNLKIDVDKTSSIDKSLTSIATFLYKTDKAIFASNNRLTFMERVNGIVKSLGEVTTDQVNRSKEMIKHQIAYLDKINNIDISKLKASAQMVESMAKLSKSIRGNFEGLAESINEDLMPVLKELKEIMGLIPEKLDTGFQNTSASIGAINNTPTKEGFAAQIRRENPNLTKEQTEAAAKSRMVDAARRLSGNRTITDLYNLFAGDIAGTKARVKIG